MADCVICSIIEGRVPSKKIYEDDEIIGFLDFNGSSPGHTFITTKKHYPILEQIPDDLVAKLFSVSNRISSALFEVLGLQGTNIFVTNGVSAGQSVAHFTINIIPRKEGDQINLLWQPKQLSEEEMSTVELKIKDATKNIGGIESKDVAPKIEKQQTSTHSVPVQRSNNYWKKVNRRIA